MAHGDPIPSPWVVEFRDYLGRALAITVSFNNNNRAVQGVVIHRDPGCVYRTVVFDNPSDQARAKRLAAPIDGAGDRSYTANQMAAQGFSTIEQARAVQITAEP